MKFGMVFAFCALSCVASAAGNAADAVVLPDWADAQIGEAVARFKEWKGTNEVVAFTFLTDVHSWRTEPSEKPDFSDTRYHPYFTFAAADRADCDFLVDGGDHDYEMGYPAPGDPQKRMAVTRSVYENYKKKPVLFCLGNHDHGPYEGPGKPRQISSECFGDTFNGLAVTNGFRLTFGSNRSWGYYDVPDKKFRAVFCNTSDTGYFAMSADQIGFIGKALDELPEGYAVAVFSHYCMFDEIGHWKPHGKPAQGKAEFIKLLEDFAKRRPHDLVGVFCGDSHFDNQLECRGVNWMISQGYGGVNPKSMPWGARYLHFDRSCSACFEIVAVKPSVGEFKVFRVGNGGAVCDRCCRYFN